MSEVLHADIFFFITAIAVIVVTVFLCIALFHAIKILKTMRKIIDRINAGAESLAEDVSRVRDAFTQDGFIGRFFGALIAPLSGTKTHSPKIRSPKKNTNSENETS